MIELKHVSKIIGKSIILDDVNLEVNTGEFVFLVGPSGCGKTTIFKLLISADRATNGEIFIDGYNITKIQNNKISMLRKQVAVVFQDFKLIPNKNVWENISFVLELQGMKGKDRQKRVTELLDLVGLSDKMKSFPTQLSGGEKQRIAIARAMATDPSILLADEPTGNLDLENTLDVISILKKINGLGTTVILATHEIDVVGSIDVRVIEMSKGRVLDQNQRSINYVKKFEKYKNITTLTTDRDQNKYNEKNIVNNDLIDEPISEGFPLNEISTRNNTDNFVTSEIYRNPFMEAKTDIAHEAEVFNEVSIENLTAPSKQNPSNYISSDGEKSDNNILREEHSVPDLYSHHNRIQVITNQGVEVIERIEKENFSEDESMKEEEKTKEKQTVDKKKKDSAVVTSSTSEIKLEDLDFPNAIETKLLTKGLKYLSEIEKLSEYELAQIVGALNVWKTVQTIRRFKHQHKL